MNLNAQKKLALSLLDWHGGQSSALYAVGSCMLSDSDKLRAYNPANYRGHAGDDETQGALERAIVELRTLKAKANYPECVSAKDERECNALADKLSSFLK